MKLQTKLFIMICTALTIFSLAVGTVQYIIISKDRQVSLSTFKKEQHIQVEQNLKNYLDIAYQALETNYNNSQDKQWLEKQYGPVLVNIIDLAQSIIEKNRELALKGTITEEEARTRSANAIGELRYSNGTGYVWINDTGKPFPKMVMHATVPALNGKVLDDKKYDCAMGKKQNLFQAMVEVSEKNGEGFVDYDWPKPTPDGLTKEQPKLSYVRLIPGWDWIIGTGIYVDDALTEAVEKSKHDIATMRYNNDKGYFWINDIGTPYPTMIMHPTAPELEGKVLDDKKYDCAMGKEQNLFQAIVEVSEKSGEGFVDYHWPKPTPDGLSKEQPKLSYVRYFEPLGWILGTGVYIDSIDTAAAAKAEQIASTTYKLFFNALMGGTVVFFFLVFAVRFFSNYFIVNGIKDSVSFAETVAAGDFTSRLTSKTNGEVGELANSLSGMSEKLGRLFLGIKGDAGTLNLSSNSLSQLSKELATGVEDLQQTASTTTYAAEEMSTNMNAIAAAMEESSINVNMVATAAEEMTSTIGEIASNTDQASSRSCQCVEQCCCTRAIGRGN